MPNLIRIKNVSKNFKEKVILKDITFQINSGEIIGLVGNNGCGKTTLLKIINNMLSPDRGSVEIISQNIKINSLSDGNRNLYWNLTGLENIEYFYNLNNPGIKFDISYIIKELKFFKLEKHIHKKVSTYSKGMKQKLLIIITFMTEPNVILLDEPLNGIDYETSIMFENYLKNYVKNTDSSMLITSHDKDFLNNLCNKMYKIEDGILKEINFENQKKYEIYFRCKDNYLKLKELGNDIVVYQFSLNNTDKLLELLSDKDSYTPMYIKQSGD